MAVHLFDQDNNVHTVQVYISKVCIKVVIAFGAQVPAGTWAWRRPWLAAWPDKVTLQVHRVAVRPFDQDNNVHTVQVYISTVCL